MSDAKSSPQKKDSSLYDELPEGLQKQWDERLFNVLKLRNALLDADSVLTFAFVLWTRFAALVAILYVASPKRFPFHVDFAYALAAFLVYYAVIGFVRRQTERYLISLCTQHPDTECMKGHKFDGRKPYDETNDPPLARFAFRLREKLCIPRRGAAQREVLQWQFVIGLCYVANYCWYVLYQGAAGDEMHPSLLWILHMTMTVGGLLILFKNAGFLVDTNKLLKVIESIVGPIFGHVHVKTNIDATSKQQTSNTEHLGRWRRDKHRPLKPRSRL